MEWWMIILLCILALAIVVINLLLYSAKCRLEAKHWQYEFAKMESIAKSMVEWYCKQNEEAILEKLPSLVDTAVTEYLNKED